MDPWNDSKEIYLNEIVDPWILEARKIPQKPKYSDNNPSFDTATRGPFQAEF
jgi:hypothetical protein